jgi:hypothetical protein
MSGSQDTHHAPPDGTPTQIAKQLDSGRWSSKRGQLQDIQHRLEDLAGILSGRVAPLLKRERS